MQIKVYVVNLAKIWGEEEAGKWLTLPMDSEELAEEMEVLAGNQDYAIWDYEAPFRIEEYTNIYELNEKLEQLEELVGNLDDDALEALFEYAYNLDEAIEYLEEGRVSFYYTGETYPTWSDLAETLVYSYDYMDIPDHLKGYIDYERIGRDLQCDGCWYLSKNGVAIHAY